MLPAPEAFGTASACGPRSWYACYTRGRHEKQVERLLEERGVSSYLPTVQRMQQWKDRRKTVATVLFPSYVFVRCALEEMFALVAVPGVVSVVRSQGRPVVVPDLEIENVRRFAAALSTIGGEAPVVALPETGSRVRIVTGPFSGVEGLVIEHRKGTRVLVGSMAIGWGVQLEIDASALQPVK